jgi:hypothetical protein
MNKKIKKLIDLFYGKNITYDLPNVFLEGSKIKMSSLRIIIHPFNRRDTYG